MIRKTKLSPFGCAFVCAAVLMAGCASRSSMTLPSIEHPPGWSAPVASMASADNSPWWDKYSDPKLGLVMRQAFESNADLRGAAYRVKSAQLQSQLVNTNGGVNVGATASVNRAKDFGSGTGTSASGANVSLSYEVDLWGKLATQRDISQWQARATRDDCEAISLSLAGTVANLYWQIAQLNQLISLGETDIEYARKTQEIVDSRYDAGAISGIAKAQAAVNVANQRAAQTRLVQSRVELRHAMAALLSKPPSHRIDELALLPGAGLPPVQVNLPAEVLGKRPDLHAAEMRLRAAFSNIDAVRTSFYPSLSLTGGLGTSSNDLLGFAKNPVAFLGGLLTLPFLQANALKLNVQVSQVQFDEAVVSFKQRLYTALTEVEDALSAKEQLETAYGHERLARDQAAVAEGMVEARYRAGFVELQLWLDAKQTLRSAERALIYTRFSQLVTESKLYKALGAGNGSPDGTCEARGPSS